MEVMVVFFACHLIASLVARDFHRLQPLILQQTLDISIERGDTQFAMMPLRSSQCLFRGQWPVAHEERIADSSFLPGLTSLHRC